MVAMVNKRGVGFRTRALRKKWKVDSVIQSKLVMVLVRLVWARNLVLSLL